MRIRPIFLAILGIGIIIACSYDQLPEPTVSDRCDTIQPTYDNSIEELMERTCAYEGCHITGFSSGDFTSYSGTTPFIQSIANRSLNRLDMPPNYAPDGKPKSLTDEEKELLECWINNGFPEN
ncbi:MAG: hypothetical protein AAFO82_00535 [Bacteroidota bacterium]